MLAAAVYSAIAGTSSTDQGWSPPPFKSKRLVQPSANDCRRVVATGRCFHSSNWSRRSAAIRPNERRLGSRLILQTNHAGLRKTPR